MLNRVPAAHPSSAAWPTGRSEAGTTDRAGTAVWISQPTVYVSGGCLRKFHQAPWRSGSSRGWPSKAGRSP